MAQTSDARDATQDIYDGLKRIFKKYSRTARERAWDRVTSVAGEKVVKRIINNPSVPTPGLDRLAFKEWLANNPN